MASAGYEPTTLDDSVGFPSNTPSGYPTSTTDVGAGPDPFELESVPQQTVKTPEGSEAFLARVGNPRFAAFAVTLLLGQVAPILPEDPNRVKFKLAAVVPNTTSQAFVGSAGQLANGYGYPILNASQGADDEFSTTAAVFGKFYDTANGGVGTPGETATVYVWVEYIA